MFGKSIQILEGDLFLTRSSDNKIKLWSLSSDKSVKTYEYKEAEALMVSKLGNSKMISIHANGEALIWDLYAESILSKTKIHNDQIF